MLLYVEVFVFAKLANDFASIRCPVSSARGSGQARRAGVLRDAGGAGLASRSGWGRPGRGGRHPRSHVARLQQKQK